MKEVEGYIEDAIKNIETDRKKATKLLDDVAKYIGGNQENHKDAGLVAAKYLETLQRSNEQLVKLVGLMSKRTPDGPASLDDDDMDDIYESLEEEDVKEVEENKSGKKVV